jgi:hypothetical protein
MSAGSPGSARTLWTRIPGGYSIRFEDHIALTGPEGGVVGTPLKIKGVSIRGASLTEARRYHLKLEYLMDNGVPEIIVSEIP